jgi:uncharacterized membrane protein (UPF0127 family)
VLMIFHKPSMSGNLSVTLIISGIVLVIVGSFLLFVWPGLAMPETKIFLGDGVFSTDLALTQSARETGLSGKNSLQPDHALLMAFPSEGEWGIWMKDMNFPIDIVWLNKDKKVIYIVLGAQPGDLKIHYPKSPAKYVVELPAGTVSSKAINTNNTATFDIEGEVK